MKKETIIDGNNFSNLDEFYDEIDKKFTKDLDFKTGHNLDAFNDILHGGFGVYEYDESVKVIWKNFEKSKKDFQDQKSGDDDLIDVILEIIRDHKHIDLILE